MNRDSRLSVALHALVHMSLLGDPVSSARLAECMGANPAHVRRTLAGLRSAGLVTSTKGRGGGWRVARPLAQISLRDVHLALGESALFAIGHRRKETSCLVERSVNQSLGRALQETEAFLLERFAAVSLEEIAKGVERQMRRGRRPPKGHAT